MKRNLKIAIALILVVIVTVVATVAYISITGIMRGEALLSRQKNGTQE